MRRLDRAPYGRALKAIREDQELASFAGKRVLRFKFEAFGVGAAVAGLAGGLYAHQQAYISPDNFDSLTTIYIFLAVTAGGLGRPISALLGGYAVVAFLEATRFMGQVLPFLDPVQLASLRGIMVGAALFLILRLRPQGLLPERIPAAQEAG
jgi:branched-chain amino acid transport system permease protein